MNFVACLLSKVVVNLKLKQKVCKVVTWAQNCKLRGQAWWWRRLDWNLNVSYLPTFELAKLFKALVFRDKIKVNQKIPGLPSPWAWAARITGFEEKSFVQMWWHQNRARRKAHGGPHGKMDSVLALHPAAPGSILCVSEKNSDYLRKIIMRCCRDLLTALLRTVDSGLIMSIEPIYY